MLSDGWFGLRSATQLHTSCINHNQEGRLAGAVPGGTARARAAGVNCGEFAAVRGRSAGRTVPCKWA